MIPASALSPPAGPPTLIVQAKAHVALDGRELYEVRGAGGFSAGERARLTSQALAETLDEAIATGAPIIVDIVEEGNHLGLQARVGDQGEPRYLVTVTTDAAMPGISPERLAQRWQRNTQANFDLALLERTPGYMATATKLTLLGGAIAVALQAGLFTLMRRQRRRHLRQGRPETQGSWSILGLRLAQIAVWIAAVAWIANLFPLSRRWLYWVDCLIRLLFTAPLIRTGEAGGVSLLQLVGVAVGIALVWQVARWIAWVLRAYILTAAGVDRTWQGSTSTFVQYGVVAIGALAILSVVGIDLGAIAIVLGAFGVGIGFGLQNIAKDFISGIIMTFERPVKVGELVQVGDTQGLVMRVGPRVTEISHIDRHIMLVPNSRFIEDIVLNWNRSGLTRVKVYVGVSYGADIEFVKAVMLEAIQQPNPDILRHPPPKVKFRTFDESSLNFRAVVFIRDPLKQPKVRAWIHDRIKAAFEHYGIEVPFPQRDLHVKLPQLEQVMEAWLLQNAPQELLDRAQEPPPERDHPHPQVQDEYDWGAIVTAMRGPQGVEIATRRFRLRTFENCFLGSDAVNWLMTYERATRDEAILMGKIMVQLGLIHHVLDEHDFEDQPLFYRFRADDPPGTNPVPQRTDPGEHGLDLQDPNPSAADDNSLDL
jgi:small-conductance mechanosensitive channel